ncbi:hypothetical protein [Brachybacterium vulturis]|uniref:hypothetical protein n=1 Tax=Brachybacterium vulturis TaxID=2017484 RepID=UPI003735D27C
MSHPSQRPGPSQRSGSGDGSTPISPLLVPMLLGGIVIGFLAGYFFVWWGLIVVAAVLVAAASMVLTGRSRDGATGAVVGVLLGYLGVILVALFRGAL